MEKEDNHIFAIHDLNQNRQDRLLVVAKGLLGIIPTIGPITTLVMEQIIPDQRFERVISFLKYLELKVQVLDYKIIENNMKTDEFIDLFEDGIQQAVRALSEERKEAIATLLKNSMVDEDLKHIEKKKLLWLLGELNDSEIIILRSYCLPENEEEIFFTRHKNTISGYHLHHGSDQKEMDADAIHATYRLRLKELGLIRPKFKRTKKGDFPEFDEKTGMLKSFGYQITPLGRLLLRKLDLPLDIMD